MKSDGAQAQNDRLLHGPIQHDAGGVQRRGIHYAELPEALPGEDFFQEWNTYRREIAGLLAQGHEGQYVLIKGTEIIGIYSDWKTAREFGLALFMHEPFFVHPIRTEEPPLRIRGLNYPCLS